MQHYINCQQWLNCSHIWIVVTLNILRWCGMKPPKYTPGWMKVLKQQDGLWPDVGSVLDFLDLQRVLLFPHSLPVFQKWLIASIRFPEMRGYLREISCSGILKRYVAFTFCWLYHGFLKLIKILQDYTHVHRQVHTHTHPKHEKVKRRVPCLINHTPRHRVQAPCLLLLVSEALLSP